MLLPVRSCFSSVFLFTVRVCLAAGLRPIQTKYGATKGLGSQEAMALARAMAMALSMAMSVGMALGRAMAMAIAAATTLAMATALKSRLLGVWAGLTTHFN